MQMIGARTVRLREGSSSVQRNGNGAHNNANAGNACGMDM